MIFTFYELCERIWDDCPAVNSILQERNHWGGRGGRLGGHGPPLHFNFRTKKGPTVSISEVIVAFKCGPLAKTEKQAVIKTGPTEKLL